ncbi:MAG: hypothetical protein CK604_02460 [Curvibacter sp. PD_MW3]|nr:MAG: hypothetical protein CK604_02460 [Curvibacter sp. PD_MW3]
MKKPQQGPSLYYASDKNIYDALNQSRVDNDTVQGLFSRRNIVCSKRTPREELSRFFSRLTHDYLDHKEISLRLGVISRRERITSVDLRGDIKKDDVTRAIHKIREELQSEGDVVHVSEEGGSIIMNVHYSTIDYKRSEFSQLQQKDGHLELIKVGNDYVLRSTHSDYVDQIRDAFARQLEKETSKPIERVSVNLSGIKSNSARSQFFYDLMSELPGYVRRDVTDVYVYKPRPNPAADDSDEEAAEVDTHVEKVLMKGNGVTQSKLLSDLIQVQNYYISRVEWIATEQLGKGFAFDVEVMFSDPKECTGFSYLLRGVYELEDNGKLSKKRRPPTKSEIDTVSRAIEDKAKELVERLNKSSITPTPKTGGTK